MNWSSLNWSGLNWSSFSCLLSRRSLLAASSLLLATTRHQQASEQQTSDSKLRFHVHNQTLSRLIGKGNTVPGQTTRNKSTSRSGATPPSHPTSEPLDVRIIQLHKSTGKHDLSGIRQPNEFFSTEPALLSLESPPWEENLLLVEACLSYHPSVYATHPWKTASWPCSFASAV